MAEIPSGTELARRLVLVLPTRPYQEWPKCSNHNTKCTSFCVKCLGSPLCCAWCKNMQHPDHKLLQVLRHRNRSGITEADISPYFDVAGIHKKKIYDDIFVPILTKTIDMKRGGVPCKSCGLRVSNLLADFCSIECKVKKLLGVLDLNGDDVVATAATTTQNQQQQNEQHQSDLNGDVAVAATTTQSQQQQNEQHQSDLNGDVAAAATTTQSQQQQNEQHQSDLNGDVAAAATTTQSQQQQNEQHQTLTSDFHHFHLYPLVENLAYTIDNGTRDQQSDSLVTELKNGFEKCQQLLNSISDSISSKMTVDEQKRKLEETEQMLTQRRDLIAKYKSLLEDIIKTDPSL